ncbi:MAG: hypothetical protein HRT71_04170, partial [Flavobacteriales bacterium]|nr:hypothetical protein [Flavobacteriales bacterium]
YVNQMFGRSGGTSYDIALGESVYKGDGSSSLGFLTSYQIVQKITKGDVHITVKTESAGNVTTHYYVNVQARSMIAISTDVGYEKGFTSYNMGEDGTIPIIDVTLNENNSTVEDVNVGGNLNTMYSYNYVVLGVSKTEVTNVTANITGYGVRSNKSMTRIYGHLLILASGTIDDVYVRETGDFTVGPYYRFSLNETVGKGRIGARIGWELINIRDFGLSGGAELGYFPGLTTSPLGDKIYFKIKSSFCFGKTFL